LRSFGRREMTLAPLTVEDTDRMAELVETYASLGLGGVDAAVIAIRGTVECGDDRDPEPA
jgi:hypothetical protein